MPVLEGIPPLRFAANERFTPIGALHAIGRSRREEVTYALLMGVSGAAFRIGWSPAWSLDMAYAAPEDLVANGALWLGLAAEARLRDPLDEAWDRVRARIDAGLPVLSCGLAGAPEFCVIAGYDDAPRRFHVRGYFEPEDAKAYAAVEVRPWQGWNAIGFGGNPLVLLREAGATDRGPLLRAALDRALRFAKVGTVDVGSRTHTFGNAAYDAWIESLRNFDDSGDLGLKAWAMAVNLSALADARRAASSFLLVLAAMKPDWSRGLHRAAEHYQHLVAQLAEAQRAVGFPVESLPAAAEKAAMHLADVRRRDLAARFMWSAKQEDQEALHWIDVVLRGE